MLHSCKILIPVTGLECAGGAAHPKAALPTTSMVMCPNWRQMLSSRLSCAALARMDASLSAPTFISLEEISSEAELNTGSQLFLALLWKSLLHSARALVRALLVTVGVQTFNDSMFDSQGLKALRLRTVAAAG